MQASLRFWHVALVPVLLVAACAGQPTRTPTEFDTAVRLLSNNLIDQFSQSKLFVGRLQEARIVSAPFIDANSGEENQIGREIERIVFEEFQQRSTALTPLRIARMTQGNIQESGYILVGTLSLDRYAGPDDAATAENRYRINASIVARDNRKVIANADIWVADADLDSRATGLYESSPIYPRDQQLLSHVAIARSPVGAVADEVSYDSLETSAALVEAEGVFESGDYARAAELYSQAAARPGGQVIRTYLGLYRCYIKMKDSQAAEAAFAKLVAIGARSNNISAKFLFAVNSTDFIPGSELRQQYAMWLRQIARYFSSSDRCLEITGHSSRTGTAEHNEKLSTARARRIQELMRPDFPAVMKRSRAIGQGFSKNLVGTGSSDTRDAIDRRVEFSVVDCK
jgi:outer membrane protein OmpA-like peptidoglycan-associated protein